jgi:ubiquinone/menaquinone biosynthesis C-methylase UbiE
MPVKRVPLSLEPIDGAAVVEKYDRYAALFMRPEYRFTAAQVVRSVIRGRILDIGTGSGRLILDLAKRNPELVMTGVDVSSDMLCLARRNFSRAGVIQKIELVEANAVRLPFKDNSFDAVVSYASLHHWRQPQAVFNEMWRVVRPGGTILVRDNRRMMGNPFYRACVWLESLFVGGPQKGSWKRSILSSYTVVEIKEMLSKTSLKNWSVRSDMFGFDLCIEAHKT